MTEKNQALERQEAIKELLGKMLVSDHKKLIELLNIHYGICTTQSVLSRDLRKIGAIKKEINQEFFYSVPSVDVTVELLKLAIIEIDYNETMIVIKTHQGLAAFVGDYVDQKLNLNILGCLAGENVVFIACKSNTKMKEIYDLLCQKLLFNKFNEFGNKTSGLI